MIEKSDDQTALLREGQYLQADPGDDAERSLGADHQAGQIVAGHGFQGPRPDAAGDHDLARGQDHFQPQDVLLRGAVLDGALAAGVVGNHAAQGAHLRASRIGGKEKPVHGELLVQLGMDDARLDRHLHVVQVHGYDAVHPGEVHHDAALLGHRAAALSCARSPGDHRDMKFICKGKDLGHLPARQDPDDEIGHPIVHLGQQRGIRRVTDPVGLGRKKIRRADDLLDPAQQIL